MTYDEITDFLSLITPIAVACLILCFVYTWAEYELHKSRKKYLQEYKRKQKLYKQVCKINLQLIEMGMSNDEIMAFWEECQQEALIQHNLPPCKDCNPAVCDTWCRGKARFVMNPPENKCG